VDVIVHFDPPDKRAAVIEWLIPLLPMAAGWEPQAAGDLGERLRRAFAWTFATGWREVAVIGSDCVTITPEIFEEAFASLATHDAAIGPTEDGGYYLLALRAPQPRLFENIRWSTEHTLADTMIQGRRLRIHRLPTLSDVDTEADWKAIHAAGE
jgi:rSAM/selenodomain-associated transferase 1